MPGGILRSTGQHGGLCVTLSAGTTPVSDDVSPGALLRDQEMRSEILSKATCAVLEQPSSGNT
jgi:hypothetical protein